MKSTKLTLPLQFNGVKGVGFDPGEWKEKSSYRSRVQ